MTVRVLFFALLRERAGMTETSVEIEPGTTAGDLWKLLQRRHPRLGDYSGPLRFAVDQAYVDATESLPDNAEVALIPPVSGG